MKDGLPMKVNRIIKPRQKRANAAPGALEMPPINLKISNRVSCPRDVEGDKSVTYREVGLKDQVPVDEKLKI